MLPARIARVDERANDFEKLQRLVAADYFCHFVNASRSDKLQLFTLLDFNRVAQLAIVQQVTMHTPRGPLHHFRFYAGERFNTEIFCSGRRLRFTDHALKRFASRTPGRFGDELKSFLMAVYDGPLIGLPCGGGQALVTASEDSVIAMPFEQEGEYLVILSRLTIHEIHSLTHGCPPYPFCLHYGPHYTVPRVRNWIPSAWATDLYNRWRLKDRLPAPAPKSKIPRWGEIAAKVRDFLEEEGHGTGSRLLFVDNIPGPCCLRLKPGEQEVQHNEMEYYSREVPGRDWEGVLARRNAQLGTGPADGTAKSAAPS